MAEWSSTTPTTADAEPVRAARWPVALSLLPIALGVTGSSTRQHGRSRSC